MASKLRHKRASKIDIAELDKEPNNSSSDKGTPALADKQWLSLIKLVLSIFAENNGEQLVTDSIKASSLETVNVSDTENHKNSQILEANEENERTSPDMLIDAGQSKEKKVVNMF